VQQDWGEDLGGRSASEVPKTQVVKLHFDQGLSTAFNNLFQLLRGLAGRAICKAAVPGQGGAVVVAKLHH
jgi:hypothetical protein